MSIVAAGPTPPEGKHRYVFLLWKQLGEVRASAVEQRKGWNPVDFAKVGCHLRAPYSPCRAGPSDLY